MIKGRGEDIKHKYKGQRVADILKQKKGGIKQAQLPEGAPSWEDFLEMTWEEIENGAETSVTWIQSSEKVAHR